MTDLEILLEEEALFFVTRISGEAFSVPFGEKIC